MLKIRDMIRSIVPVLIIAVIITGSCSGRKSSTGHKDLIPEDILADVLTDLYLADGLLTLPKIREMVSDKDSIETQMEVIGKYGYTVDDMNNTLKYYFIKRPKKIVRIYDMVLGRLSKMESIYMNEASVERIMSEEMWPGEKNYLVPGSSGADTAGLFLKIIAPGTYTLTYSIRIYPDDQKVRPESGLWIYHPDRPDSLRREDLATLPYIKDGRAHNCTITLNVPEMSEAYIRGWFVNYVNQHPATEKHMIVEKISLRGSRLQ